MKEDKDIAREWEDQQDELDRQWYDNDEDVGVQEFADWGDEHEAPSQTQE